MGNSRESYTNSTTNSIEGLTTRSIQSTPQREGQPYYPLQLSVPKNTLGLRRASDYSYTAPRSSVSIGVEYDVPTSSCGGG